MDAVKNLSKPILIVFSIVVTVSSFSSVAHAGTTTADFLKWEKKAQESFLEISISMAAVIASQLKPNFARCVDGWYFSETPGPASRNAEMLAEMPKYAAYQPNAVILGFLEQACGKLN